MSQVIKEPILPPELEIKLDTPVVEEEEIVKEKETLPSSKKNILTIVLIISLFLIVGLAIFIFFQNSKKQSSLEVSNSKTIQKSFSQIFEQIEKIKPPSPTPTPRPSPIWILPGKETYTISQSNKAGPRIKKISIDPQDPTTNDSTQTISAELSYSQPIDQVKLKLISDNEEKLVEMILIEGTKKNGVWETTWEITDSILYNYIITVTVISQNQQATIDLTIR